MYRVASTDEGAVEPLFLLIRDSYRNWGFPKGHLEAGELPEDAAVREVGEETGVAPLVVRGEIETIDWYFRFRGRLIHKVCHFYLMETPAAATCPQRAEGITACRWAPFEEAERLVSYANAREVLQRAHAMVSGGSGASNAVPDAAHDDPARVAAGPTPPVEAGGATREASPDAARDASAIFRDPTAARPIEDRRS